MSLSHRAQARRGSQFWAVLALVAAVPLAVAGCGGQDESRDAVTDIPTASGSDKLAPQPLKEPATIQISIARLEAYADVYVAQAKGEFEKENLTVEVQNLPTADGLLLLAQGKLDATGAGANASLFSLIAQGSEVRAVMPTQDISPEPSGQGVFYNKSVVNPDGGELKATDFKGVKFLTPSGPPSSVSGYFYDYLTTLPDGDQIKPTDLAIEAQPDGSAVTAALLSGAAGVGKVTAPFNAELLDNPCCELLPEDLLPTEGGVYAFGPSMEEQTDVGAAFVRALARTRQEYLTGNYRENAEINGILAEALDVDASALAQLPPIYYDPNLAFDDEASLGNQKFFRAYGILQYDKDLTFDDVYDDRYVKALGFGA